MIPSVEVEGDWDAVLDGPSRTTLEQTALPDFLRAQRWFGGKARQITAVRVVDWGRLTIAPTAFAAVLEVAYADGEPEQYFVPLAVTATPDEVGAVARLTGPAGEAVLRDALTDDAVCAALLTAVGEGREFPTRPGRIRGTATTAFADLRDDPSAPLAVERGPATSSNSLVFYGQRLLLKVFRRMQSGVNPDYEVGRFLTERAGFDRTPRVAGVLEYVRPDSEPSALGLLQEIVPSQGDGWDHALRELNDYYESDEEAVGDYLQAAATLGRQTAQMHLALASDPHDPAFAPEPLTATDADALRDDVLLQGRRALAVLGQALDRLPADVASAARRLLDEAPAALDHLAGSPVVVPAAAKTRVHGDYHLAQLLWTGGDYYILDFEGEPTRPLAERRAKSSPVRDVAGMLRSYHYAAYAGLFDRPADFARLEPRVREWLRQVSALFLDSYRTTAGQASFLPRDSREFAAMLDLYTLGKAFFELNYELNNRPDWVRIPLQGVLELIGPRSRDR